MPSAGLVLAIDKSNTFSIQLSEWTCCVHSASLKLCQDGQIPMGDLEVAILPYGRILLVSMCIQLGPVRTHSDPGGSYANDILARSTFHLGTTAAYILVVFEGSQHLLPFQFASKDNSALTRSSGEGACCQD